MTKKIPNNSGQSPSFTVVHTDPIFRKSLKDQLKSINMNVTSGYSGILSVITFLYSLRMNGHKVPEILLLQYSEPKHVQAVQNIEEINSHFPNITVILLLKDKPLYDKWRGSPFAFDYEVLKMSLCEMEIRRNGLTQSVVNSMIEVSKSDKYLKHEFLCTK